MKSMVVIVGCTVGHSRIEIEIMNFKYRRNKAYTELEIIIKLTMTSYLNQAL